MKQFRFQKYVLISMILYGKVIALPSYRAAMIPRTVKRLCADYTAVETLSQNKEHGPDVAGALLQHLEQHRAVFEAVRSVLIFFACLFLKISSYNRNAENYSS